jgi:Secretion system C-terminal sorting domain
MKKYFFTFLCSLVVMAASFAQTHVVTFQVSNPDQTPVYLHGSWDWGYYPGVLMTSVGGGFYTANVTLPENATYEYLFRNGATYVSEVLNPADACTNGNAVNTNRVLNLGAADMTVCNTFASCNTCTVPGGTVQVTFEVQNPDQTPVFVFGSWSNWTNWPGDAMTPIGNGKYSITLPLTSASAYEYLFVNGTTPMKEVLDPTAPCTNGNTQYTNRTLTTMTSNQTICGVWGSCGTCTTPVQAAVDLPLTFTDPLMNYGLTDFGGNSSSVVADPTNAANMVGKSIKDGGAQLWAGTTVGGTVGFANAIPFAAGMTAMTMRVWSPDAGIKVRLKAEDPADATHTVETEAMTTVANQWETLVFNFANQAPGTAAINYAYTFKKASVFFNFGVEGAAVGAKTYYWDDMIFTGTPPPPPVALPLTFEDAMINYALVDFGGAAGSSVVVDPTNPANKVAMTTKTAGAQTWAGTTVGGATGFATAVPFAPNRQTMTMRVWSPDAGAIVLLKVEEQLNTNNFVEKQAVTTMAGAWETLTFDFSTAGINPAFAYKKASVFFNFGVVPSADKTYYWDDMMLLPAPPPAGVDLPVTFDNAALNYGLTDFGGTNSSIVADPTMPTNMVGKTIKTAGAQTWGGTTVGAAAGFQNPIPFAPGMTAMTLRVWSPDAGTVVRLKVEDAADGSRFVETDATTTAAGQWETLVFNYPNYNPAYIYKKASVFFAFGTSPSADKTYYWDDMIFAGAPPAPPVTLPLTFTNPAINYGLTDFGGTNSSIVADPTNAMNTVGKTIKTAGAQTWGGTTVGGAVGFATAVPFAANANTMSLRVWSPDAGTVVRLKVEDANDGSRFVETDATTTMAGQWETLQFSYPNYNPVYVYKKASVFFAFGTSPSADKTYYWDDMMFVTPPPAPPVTLPLTFTNPAINYALIDFGGTNSSIVVDPTDAMNTVGKTIKTTGAQTWAGTTVGGTAGFAQSIPLAAGATKMNMRVWSPDAGIPVMIKVEDPADATKSVETLAATTVAGAWEILEFDFATQRPGTAAINFAYNYQKASVFFNFGVDGATAGEKTYYWDDMMFGPRIIATENALQNQIALNLSKNGVNVFSNTVTDLDEVQIFDVLGRTVYASNRKLAVNNLIPVALSANTVYFIRVKTNNETATFKKMIVE